MQKYILYIEDEAFQAKLFGKIIADEVKDAGHKVKIINSGLDAIKFFSGESDILNIKPQEIGLILLDLTMYDIGGFQVLERLAKLKNKIPVAILTAREEKAAVKGAKDLGAIEYFVKGKDLNELNRLRGFIMKVMG